MSAKRCAYFLEQKTGLLGTFPAAFGVSESEADSTVRISFSKYNNKAEVDELAEALALGKSTLIPVRVFKRK